MIGSNLTHRGMTGGLAVRVSAPAAVSSDRFIGGVCAQSARKILVLVLGSFLGTWRRVSGLSKKMGYTAYPLTLASLGERSHRLSKARQNFETRIMTSRMSSNGIARPFRHAQVRAREVRIHHFFCRDPAIAL
jgi:hypothetical protein